MKIKTLIKILYLTAFLLAAPLGAANATQIQIGNTVNLLSDSLWADTYPGNGNPNAKNDNSFNVNWLADNYSPDSTLPETVLPLNLTILGKYEPDKGWEKTVWNINNPNFDEDFSGADGYWSLVSKSFGTPLFFSVKAGPGFALYYTGDVTAADWENLYQNGKDLSHISFWTADASPVPEPSTFLLFGLGCLGLASIGRKQFL